MINLPPIQKQPLVNIMHLCFAIPSPSPQAPALGAMSQGDTTIHQVK
jgi:hypothetical protein